MVVVVVVGRGRGKGGERGEGREGKREEGMDGTLRDKKKTKTKKMTPPKKKQDLIYIPTSIQIYMIKFLPHF